MLKIQNWQDKLITVGQYILALSLLPTLLSDDAKIPLWHSIPTAVILFTFVIAFSSLKLRGSMRSSFVAFVGWVLVALLRH